jgi:hypothetical protein
METFLLILVSFLIGLFAGILSAIKYTNSKQEELTESIADKIAVVEELRSYVKQLDDRLNTNKQSQ